MKRIPLTQRKEALVSDRDYAFLMQWSWCFLRCSKGNNGYAKRLGPHGGAIYMHKVVAARKGIIGQVDHRDRNKLNNQRRNLRPASNPQNRANVKRRRDNTSGCKGVSWYPRYKKWRARLQVNGKSIHVGYFKSKRCAARAYDKAARRYVGKYAVLNKV